MKYSLHRPWADILFETTLPPTILEKMIEISDKVLGDSKRTQWGHNLAGQIKEESLITSEMMNTSGLKDFFGNMCCEYIHQCNLQQAPPDQYEHLKTVKNHVQVTLNSMWIVEQQPGEYSPLHTHTDCDISGVMYLKIPKFLDSEKPDKDDDGAISFLGGTGITKDKLKMSTRTIKPKAGQFFIFPSHMMHTVYPYKTNDNFARRSVSFNASIDKFE